MLFKLSSEKFKFHILILSVCMLVPLSVDIFISGLPEISMRFPGENVSLILGITILGMAVSQLFYGPLLDYYGRRPVLLAGLVIFTLASILVMCAQSFSLLIVGRLLQAVGGCSGTVAVFAIVKDTYDKEKILPAIGLVMAMIGVSPIIAPLIGSFLNTSFNWRASFVFLFFLGCFYTIYIYIYFKETLLNKNLESLKGAQIFKNYWQFLRNKKFLVYCFTNGLTYCILFSYLNISAFFIIEKMQFSLVAYGWIVALNAIAIIIMAKVSPKIAQKISLLRTIKMAYFIILLGGVMMSWLSYRYSLNIYVFMLPMFLTTIGAGVIRPTVNASAMQLADKSLAGTAAAMFNFISFLCGGAAGTFLPPFIQSITQFGEFIIFVGISCLLMIFWVFSTPFLKVVKIKNEG